MAVMLGTDTLYDLIKYKVRRSRSNQLTNETAMTESEKSTVSNQST
jgi:hypothetical protein